jgi:opacity protein-like surface antigen
MKRFVLAIVVACALSGSALAGDIHSVGGPAPAPGEIHTTGETAPGDIHSTGAPAPGEIPISGLSVVLMFLDLAF